MRTHRRAAQVALLWTQREHQARALRDMITALRLRDELAERGIDLLYLRRVDPPEDQAHTDKGNTAEIPSVLIGPDREPADETLCSLVTAADLRRYVNGFAKWPQLDLPDPFRMIRVAMEGPDHSVMVSEIEVSTTTSTERYLDAIENSQPVEQDPNTDRGQSASSVLLDDTVSTDYGILDLAWITGFAYDGTTENFYADQVNGLLGASNPEGVTVSLGRRSGGSHVRIELHDSRPEIDDSWEDIVEASTTIPEGAEPKYDTCHSWSTGPLAILPGTYRIRLSCRGRDTGHAEEFADEVVDWYLIQLWPAAATADEIIKTTSEDAANWHQSWGSSR